MRNNKLIFLTILLFSLNCFSSSIDNVRNYVNNIGDQVISIIEKKDLGSKEKNDELSKIFLNVVDTAWIGKFVMGKYFKSLTVDQQNNFLDRYTKYLIQSYVPSFRKYAGGGFKIINILESRAKEFVVQTEIKNPEGGVYKIDYMLSEKSSNNYVIFDIVAEGVSLITTQRAELGSIMYEDGFKGVMDQLEKKIF